MRSIFLRKIMGAIAVIIAIVFAAVLVLVALNPNTLLLASAATSGSSGEDKAKIALVETLRNSLKPGMTEQDAVAALNRVGVSFSRGPAGTFRMGNQAQRGDTEILAAISRVRWRPLFEEQVFFQLTIDNGLVSDVNFKSLWAGP